MSGTKLFPGMALMVFSLALAHADKFLDGGMAHISSQEVEQQFYTELRSLLGHGDDASSLRLEQLQLQLRPMYLALPKGADGDLDSGAARYALHRFFLQKHGWHVRGLEATGAERWGDASSTAMFVDHIPGYVLQLLERHSGSKTGLRELAMIAATLEDVVHSEAIQLLSTAYVAQGIPFEATVVGEVERRLIATYLLYYIMPNPKYASLTTTRLNEILRSAANILNDTVMWVEDLQGANDHSNSLKRNPFLDLSVTQRDFNSVVNLVEDVGEHYGQFQNLVCRGMKNDLLDLSDGAGRVLLSKFYQASMNDRTKHFNESPEYLRHLGLLDETDPERPQLILANYMYSRNNCIASSSLYSVCCIDECEPLLASVERTFANPLAEPERLVEAVTALSSDTVSGPRELPLILHQRLDDIARRHGGSIPLHGRLFAQWMHHAFPNECPFPHSAGSLAPPLTPAEWLKSGPERRVSASMEQIEAFIQSATSLNNVTETFDEIHQGALLPWTDEEELVGEVPTAHPFGRAGLWCRLAALLLAMLSAAAGLVKMLMASPLSPMSSGKAGKCSIASPTGQAADSQWV